MKCTIERDYRQMGGGFLGHWSFFPPCGTVMVVGFLVGYG